MGFSYQLYYKYIPTFQRSLHFLLHSQSEQGGDTDTFYTQGARKSQSDAYEQQRKDNGKQDMWKPYNKNGLVAAVDLTGHLATCLHNLSASSPSSLVHLFRPHSDTTENYNLKMMLYKLKVFYGVCLFVCL